MRDTCGQCGSGSCCSAAVACATARKANGAAYSSSYFVPQSDGLGLENVEYEPEQFPGLVYRIKQPKVVVLIFSSGKLVITGGKSPEECEEGARIVRMQLENMGLL